MIYFLQKIKMSDELIRKVREYLRRRDISQEQLAHKIGVSYTTLNRWLNRKTKPKSQAIIEAIRKEIEAQ